MCVYKSRSMRQWLVIGQSILQAQTPDKYLCQITSSNTIRVLVIDKQTVATGPKPAKILYEHCRTSVKYSSASEQCQAICESYNTFSVRYKYSAHRG